MKKGGGGAEKVRGGKGFSHAEGGGGRHKSFGVIFTWKLEVLAIFLRGTQKVSTL